MITIGTVVKKQGSGKLYYVQKMFSTFAQIEPINRDYLEEISGITEYIDYDLIEEYIDERTNRDATSNDQ